MRSPTRGPVGLAPENKFIEKRLAERAIAGFQTATRSDTSPHNRSVPRLCQFPDSQARSVPGAFGGDSGLSHLVAHVDDLRGGLSGLRTRRGA